MKKLIFVGLFGLILLAGLTALQAQSNVIWKPVNQFTAGWDAVTTDVDGDPFPVGTTLHYRLYLANAATDPNKTNPVQVADVLTTQATITVGTKGQYYVGIRAVLVYDTGETEEGAVNWADEPADQPSVDLWAVRRGAPPKTPQNLVKQ